MESPLSPEEDIPGASFGESEQDLNLNKGETTDRISNANEEDNRDDVKKDPLVPTNDMDDSGSGYTEQISCCSTYVLNFIDYMINTIHCKKL